MADASTALSIPTVVWSGIVAAAISLAGVVLSNWSTAKRLRAQLAHDSREKINDRLATLRKEVYLQLISDVSAMQGHLGALASKDPTSPEFSAPIQTANAQLSKVQLVGGAEAMKHASELMALYTESLFSLILAARPLHDTRIDINLADQSYNQFLQQAQRAANEITIVLESGNPDEARVLALQRSRDGFQELSAGYAEERNQAWDRYNLLQLDFIEAVKAQIAKVAPTQALLLAALKNDIGVVTDASVLLAQIESNQRRMELAMRSMLSELLPPKA